MLYSIVSRTPPRKRALRRAPQARRRICDSASLPARSCFGHYGAMSIRAVAFDVHDTLAYFAPGRVRPIEVQRLLQSCGLSISFQAYEAARQAVLFLDGARRPIAGW